MKVPAVSAHPRVSVGCASLTSLLISDELSIFLKSAGVRRFFMALALLFLLLPSPPAEAGGATACPIGERLFNGSCYDCQNGYDPDILFDPPVNGACILKTTAPFAGTYHNCDIFAGEWDGFDGFCYKPCTGGYVRSGNSCVLTSTTGQAMAECGTRSRTCTTNPKGICPLISAAACDFAASIGANPWIPVTTCTPYSYTGCGSSSLIVFGREGPFSDKFYSCPGGTTTEAGTYNDPNKCTKTSTSTISTKDKKIGCADGTFQGGLSGSCFKCGPTFTRNSLLLPETPGACFKTSSASIVTPKKAKEACVRPFIFSDQGNCDNGLLCTAGLGALECRNVPARVGEVCGAADDCDGNNYCLNQRCVARQVAGGSCTGLGQGTCTANLVCDFGTGTCRNDPPTVGQPCGAGQCAGDLVCSAVIGGVCQKRGESTDSCIGLGQGSCADGLVCDFFGGECRSEVPQKGELCDSTVVPCASADLGGNRVDLSCHSNGFGQPFRCDDTKQVGEVCSGLFQGSCADNMSCSVTYDLQAQPDFSVLEAVAPVALNSIAAMGAPFELLEDIARDRVGGGIGDLQSLENFPVSAARVLDPLKLRCIPQPELGPDLRWQKFDEQTCKNLHSWSAADKVTNQQPIDGRRWSYSYGMTGAMGAGIQFAVETGVLYEPASRSPGDGYQGRYGCYQTTCQGIQVGVGADLSACMGAFKTFPYPGLSGLAFTSLEFVSDTDLFSLFPNILTSGLSIKRTYGDLSNLNLNSYEELSDDLRNKLASFNSCTFTGLGKGVPVLGSQAGNVCETRFVQVTPPTRPGTTLPGTDVDGDGDVAGAGCGVDTTVSIRSKSGQLQLTWPPYTGAESYVIRRSEIGPDAGYETVVEAHQTTYATYLDEGRTNGVTYWYKIAPKDAVGTEMCTTGVASGMPAARTRTR